MTASAPEGLEQLGAAQRAASEAVGGGAAGFKETGRAYARFALANPALFRLIFASPALLVGGVKSDIGSEAHDLLQANAAAARGGGSRRFRRYRPGRLSMVSPCSCSMDKWQSTMNP